jgi:hypothetical protein
MTRRMNEIGMRTRKARAELLEKDDFGVYVHLFGLGQSIPPDGKLV